MMVHTLNNKCIQHMHIVSFFSIVTIDDKHTKNWWKLLPVVMKPAVTQPTSWDASLLKYGSSTTVHLMGRRVVERDILKGLVSQEPFKYLSIKMWLYTACEYIYIYIYIWSYVSVYVHVLLYVIIYVHELSWYIYIYIIMNSIYIYR